MSAKNTDFLDATSGTIPKLSSEPPPPQKPWLSYLDPETRLWLQEGDPVQVSLGVQFGCNVMRMNAERLLPAYLEYTQATTSDKNMPNETLPTSSYQIGQDGEEYVIGVLQKCMNESRVESTTWARLQNRETFTSKLSV